MPVSVAMKSHLLGTVTLNVFITITAKDGTILRFHNGTRNKIIGGNVFYAQPLDPSQLKATTTLNPDNADIKIVLHGMLTRANLLAGKWSGARVEYAVYNYRDFSMGYAERRVFYLGDVEVGRYQATPELNSLMQKLSEPTGLTQLETCNAQLGGDRCGVDLEGDTATGKPIKQTATITEVINDQRFLVDFDTEDDIPDDFYKEGVCLFTSGNNEDFEIKIIYNISSDIVLWLPAPSAIAVDDTVLLTAGCDKKILTCRDKYANAENNRSIWPCPGRNKLITLP